jgi:hypothetical protein
MSWRRLFILALSLIVILSSACIKRVERQAVVDFSCYFPLDENDQFIYDGAIGRGVVTSRNGSLYTVTFYDSSGLATGWADFVTTESGVDLKNLVPRSSIIPSVHFEPSLPFSPRSSLVGDTLLVAATEIRGDSANSHLRIMVSYEVMAVGTLSVPAGDFADCIEIRMLYNTLNGCPYKPFDGESHWWFAKDVGLVKYSLPADSGRLLESRRGKRIFP